MSILHGFYRLRAVWVDTEGETRVFYDRTILESVYERMQWKKSIQEKLECYGGVIKSITVDPCDPEPTYF